MRRPGFLALTLLAPLIFAASFWLQGCGTLPPFETMVLALGALFIGTPLVSAIMALLCFKSVPTRIGAFFASLVVQALIFCTLPPGSQIEMTAIARRLKRDVPITAVAECATNLVRRFHDGTLVTNATPPALLYPPVYDATAIIAESELPEILKGKFRSVTINTNLGVAGVFFESEPYIGIACTIGAFSKTVCHRELADGVHAYRYQRP